MKNLLLIFIILFSFNSYSQSQDFTDYYYNLNMALSAKHNNKIKLSNKYLLKAFYAFPKQETVPMQAWVYAKILMIQYDKNPNDIIALINKQKAYSDKTSFLKLINNITLRTIVDTTQTFYNKEDFYIKNYEKAKMQIDTLVAVDQYVCKKRDKDSVFVKDEYKKIDGGLYGSNEVVFQLLKSILKEYKFVGNFTCDRCTIFPPIVHLTNFEYFTDINDMLLNLVKNGYLTPNEYAWAFDRSYNIKFGTYYYYFSMNNPFNTEHYIPIKDLSKTEIKEINARRRIIGLMSLPHGFSFLENYEF